MQLRFKECITRGCRRTIKIWLRTILEFDNVHMLQTLIESSEEKVIGLVIKGTMVLWWYK